MSKNLSLVCEVYVEAHGFGTRYRLFVNDETNTPFTTKGAAMKHATKLKKYAKKHYRTEAVSILVGDKSSFQDYTYRGPFPSLSYTHINVAFEKL